MYLGNDVHEDISKISDNELTGSDAVREIIIVDTKNGNDTDGYYAIKRNFAVIVESEGNGTEAYQCSGTFKVKGEKIFGKAKTTDDWASCVFTEDSAE